MGDFTTHVKTTSEAGTRYLSHARRPERIKLLDEPSGYISSLEKDNLPHQMRFSVRTLEGQLAAAGTPHVLQLDLAFEDDASDPYSWALYADGIKVLGGDGGYARQCFVEDARLFLETCHEAVEDAALDELSEREYFLLCRARDIARHEPYEEGFDSCVRSSLAIERTGHYSAFIHAEDPGAIG